MDPKMVRDSTRKSMKDTSQQLRKMEKEIKRLQQELDSEREMTSKVYSQAANQHWEHLNDRQTFINREGVLVTDLKRELHAKDSEIQHLRQQIMALNCGGLENSNQASLPNASGDKAGVVESK